MSSWAKRQQRRAFGLCFDCDKKAKKGRARCDEHLRKNTQNNKKPVDAIKEHERTNIPKNGHIYDPNTPVLLDRIQKISDALRSERDKTTHIVNACISSINSLKFNKVKRPILPKQKSLNLDMHVLRSDAQVGSRVDPQFTSGLGKYDWKTYVSRLERLTQKIFMFHEQDHKALGLKRLISPQLGDQVEGELIFPGQSYTLELPLVDQVFQSVEVEVNRFWLPLSEIFDNIELFCVIGNHGRQGRKGDGSERTNWDYVYYRCLKQILETSTTHVKVHVSESPIMLVEHGKYLFCYKHGDDVQSWMGVPYYGLDRSVNKTSRMFNRVMDYTCVGHFHQPGNLSDTIFINGTMVGGSSLSINKMACSGRPSQEMFYFDNNHGINRKSTIYLADRIEMIADNNGILTPISNGLEITQR